MAGKWEPKGTHRSTGDGTDGRICVAVIVSAWSKRAKRVHLFFKYTPSLSSCPTPNPPCLSLVSPSSSSTSSPLTSVLPTSPHSVAPTPSSSPSCNASSTAISSSPLLTTIFPSSSLSPTIRPSPVSCAPSPSRYTPPLMSSVRSTAHSETRSRPCPNSPPSISLWILISTQAGSSLHARTTSHTPVYKPSRLPS